MIGLDLGSRHVKMVQMEGRQIVKRQLWDTIDFYRTYIIPGQQVLRLKLDDIDVDEQKVVATGYGKITVQIPGVELIPEIQAHVVGAAFQTGLSDFTLIDIGGQDTKVILVKNRRAVDFLTNDRCAASSGRYLENMAVVLGVDLNFLSQCSDEPTHLNSTCAIFGETEIIGRIVEGASLESMAAGVNYALYKRLAGMLTKLSSPIMVLAGGVAYNKALQNIIRAGTGSEIICLPEPQFNGAIGCCVYGGVI